MKKALKTKGIGLALVFLFLAFNACAQSKNALKQYEKARVAISQNRDDDAIVLLDKALKSSPDFADAAGLAGEIMAKKGKMPEANSYFRAAYEAQQSPFMAFRFGSLNYQKGLYSEALYFINFYLESDKQKEPYTLKAKNMQQSCLFAIEAIKNTKPFKSWNLGPNINTEAAEYFPGIMPDNRMLVFTRRAFEGPRQDENFFYSSKDNRLQWERALPLPGKLNSPLNEGAQTVRADGKELIFVGCNRQDSYGSCDLYVSIWLENEGWSVPKNLGDSLNTANWETQPCFSPDGNSLVFIRGKKLDGDGADIYISQRKSNGQWSKARKLPGSVNSLGRESSPFWHFDSQTLYFSSDGHLGMGGYDFFVSRKDSAGHWGEPKNLGHPINSFADEIGLSVGPDGKTAYYNTNLPGGYGEQDIYGFELLSEFRPMAIAFVKGRIRDAKTAKPLQANLKFTDLVNGESFLNTLSDVNGEFWAILPANHRYSLNVESPNYLFHSELFELKNQTADSALSLIVNLQALESGSVLVLKNVFFETASFELKNESSIELLQVVSMMKSNPKIKISVEGHTDSEGHAADNQKLSENRAKSVRQFLIKQGIEATRIQWKGFGQDRPIDDNSTELGRSRNRRTELRIL